MLALHRDVVRPEWTDYNGHMSEAYYVLVLGDATDAFYDHVGLDAAFRALNRVSVYTVESHLRYLVEAHRGERLLVRTQLLDVDAKRLHLWHAMIREDDDVTLATSELLLLHVDMAARKAVPFLPATVRRLASVAATQSLLQRPEHAGRSIGIRRVAPMEAVSCPAR
jgi:acyl-CoA thioester hydrolase